MPESKYPGPGSIHRHLLPNGLIILVFENPITDSVVIEGLVQAGALIETRANAGTASFTSEMLMRGTTNRSFEEIYEDIESVGASLDFAAGRHISEFSGSCLTEDSNLLIDMLAESLIKPSFPLEQLEQVRGEFLTSLQIRANNTRFRATEAFRELLYNEHPYGRLVDGYLESVSQINVEDLARFHRDYYGPDGMIITLVGAVNTNQVVDQVKAAFGDWRPKQVDMPSTADAPGLDGSKRVFVPMEDKSQSDIILGVPGPRRSAADYLEASVANTILGVFGMMGRLGQSVREEQGLAYYAYSQVDGGLGPSPWSVSTGVAPQNVEQAIESVIHEIERLLTEPIPEDELEDTKAYRTGSLPVSLETNDGLANIITDMEFYDLGLDYLQLLPEKISAMNPDTVQAAAANYLNIDKLAISVAGPELVERDKK
jgi:zinc protease